MFPTKVNIVHMFMFACNWIFSYMWEVWCARWHLQLSDPVRQHPHRWLPPGVSGKLSCKLTLELQLTWIRASCTELTQTNNVMNYSARGWISTECFHMAIHGRITLRDLRFRWSLFVGLLYEALYFFHFRLREFLHVHVTFFSLYDGVLMHITYIRLDNLALA